jgi:hypothetical protein
MTKKKENRIRCLHQPALLTQTEHLSIPEHKSLDSFNCNISKYFFTETKTCNCTTFNSKCDNTAHCCNSIVRCFTCIIASMPSSQFCNGQPWISESSTSIFFIICYGNLFIVVSPRQWIPTMCSTLQFSRSVGNLLDFMLPCINI